MEKKLSNYERAARFLRPDYIPMAFSISGAYWASVDQEALCDLIEAHPLLFPGFVRPKLPFEPDFSLVARADAPYTDDFGCVWTTSISGLTGTVTGHPLADWESYGAYQFPDPEKSMGLHGVDWRAEADRIAKAKADGKMAMAGLRHGHTFLQLSDLRGYENLMIDMADEEPLLMDLIERLEAFNLALVTKYVALGVDMMGYAEDLGMQIGPMLSPAHFRRYIKPSYRRLMDCALDHGVLVHLHSDGDIRALIDDLLDDGVQIMNLQDLVNGIDWIRDTLKGKVAIELDIDRQLVTPYGTPAQVDQLILEAVQKLGSREGGLLMIYGLYPGVPLENAKALMDAMEKYAGYYS